MVVDFLGAVFSILSLAFKSHFDTTAAVTYSLVAVMDGLVLVLAVILNPRARRRATRADPTGRVETPRGCDGDGGGNHDGVMKIVSLPVVTPAPLTIELQHIPAVKRIVSVVQQDNEKGPVPRTVP